MNKLRRYAWGYAFILPSMLTFVLFSLLPTLWAIVISLQKYNLRKGGVWMSPLYENYLTAFTQLNWLFVTAIKNTLVYTLFTVASNILIGLMLASLIQPLSNRWRTFFRAAYYLPAVTSALIVGMTWSYIYNAQWGFANYLLALLGMEPVRWLSDPDIALTSITLSTILTVPATAVVLFSAAIGSIPPDYYEAAQLDGAGPFRRWWHITLPLIRSTTLYLVVIYTIASFEVFEKIYVMAPSGVGNSTHTIVTQIYFNGFQQFNYGVASAQAFVLFLMIGVVAFFQFRILSSDVQY